MVRSSKPNKNTRGQIKRSANGNGDFWRQVTFVLKYLLDGESVSTIISKLDDDKENAMACILLLIHYRWIEYHIDNDSAAETWIVTTAGKAALKKALNYY